MPPGGAGRFACVCFLVVALLSLNACGRGDTPSSPPVTSASPSSAHPAVRTVGPLTPDEAQALATMNKRVKEYIALRTKLEQSLPKVPKDATPEQIDTNQHSLAKLLRQARATARPGDIFTPESSPVIKRLVASVFDGPDGKQLKASIMDENPVTPAAMKFGVNSPYPDSVPLTTVPPQVLQTLPKLTEDLEYRFVGDWLILLDGRAHVIADFIEDVLPK
jgi:hypothetical protein